MSFSLFQNFKVWDLTSKPVGILTFNFEYIHKFSMKIFKELHFVTIVKKKKLDRDE